MLAVVVIILLKRNDVVVIPKIHRVIYDVRYIWDLNEVDEIIGVVIVQMDIS